MNLYPTCPIVRVPRQLSLFGQRLVTEGWLNFEHMYQIETNARQQDSSLLQSVESSLDRQLSAPMRTLYHRLRLLEHRVLYGVNFIDSASDEIATEQVASLINNLRAIDICRRHRVLPLGQSQENSSSVLIGMVEPDDLLARDDISRLLRERSMSPVYIGILPEYYQRLIEEYLDTQAAEQTVFEPSANESVESYVSEHLDTAPQGAGAAPIIGLVNKLLVKAFQEDVSSLYLDPQELGLKIRVRKNGKLQDFLTTSHLPRNMIPAITARLKLMANLDISERRLPQEGRVRRIFNQRKPDIQINTLPSRFGEAITLKRLNPINRSAPLEDLIPNPANLSIIRNMMARSSGVLIVTGTSGLEKEMLYSLLRDRHTDNCRVMTIEETIDQTLPGITQVLLSPHQPDKDQLSLVLACLRQEPDIVLLETLDMHQVTEAVLKAAQKQTLIITTMSARDPIGAIQQLLEMGIAPYVITRTLIGIISQQFVRRLCESCQSAYSLSAQESTQFDLPLQPYEGTTFYRPPQRAPEASAQNTSVSSTTCVTCGGAAYQDQIAVLETLQLNDRFRQLLSQTPSAEILRAEAQRGGMQSYFEQAMDLAQAGLTSLEEIENMCQP